MQIKIFQNIGVSFSEINTLSCMYYSNYSNCNSSFIGNYDATSPCWQNIYSRSPSLVSQQCTSNSQTSAFCFAYSYSYTNYLTNSLVGYLNFNQGCFYVPTDYLTTYLNIYNSATSYNYSSVVPGTNLPLTLELKYLLCNTSDCNSQYAGACISAELVQTIFSSNLTSVGNLTSLPVYQNCSSSSSGISPSSSRSSISPISSISSSSSSSSSSRKSSSSSSLPTFKLTITIGLKVNQVFISDYNNLNSAASLSFIQNFTNFVNIHINYI